jgi:phosphoribosyl 1,2-cyclic phosphodiesterase
MRESISPWNCYGFYVNKHSDKIRGVPRLVVKYSPLNLVIDDDTYPIPHKSSPVNRITNAKIFSKFDLKSGFWQVAIKEEEKFKTTFSVPAGHYEWNVMPFDLKNTLEKFQMVMDDTLKEYFDCLIVYIDDILVFSDFIDQHFNHLEMFLKVIKQSGLVLSKNKMELFKTLVKFMGHTISNGQVSL